MPVNLNEAQLYEEYNTLTSFDLCYQGQELVQELVNKVAETVQILRHLSIHLLHSDQTSFLQRKQKLEELFSAFEIILKRLRLIGSIVNQRKIDLDLRDQIENNISQEIEDLKKQQVELKEQVKVKNCYLKLAIDKLTDIIWNINSIQSIKQI